MGFFGSVLTCSMLIHPLQGYTMGASPGIDTMMLDGLREVAK